MFQLVTMSDNILPPHLEQEQMDTHDHVHALRGYGNQMVSKGQTITDHLGSTTTSYQCRASLRKGSGRRCRNMCRHTFPYCYVHSAHKLGVTHNKFKDGLIVLRDFDVGEVISTMTSVDDSVEPTDNDMYVYDQTLDKNIRVLIGHPSLSTLGSYARRTNDENLVNSEYITFEYDAFDVPADEQKVTSMIVLVCTKPLKSQEEVIVQEV